LFTNSSRFPDDFKVAQHLCGILTKESILVSSAYDDNCHDVGEIIMTNKFAQQFMLSGFAM
jgi:hypothetical protein